MIQPFDAVMAATTPVAISKYVNFHGQKEGVSEPCELDVYRACFDDVQRVLLGDDAPGDALADVA